jgi:hypothetical protein
MMLVEVLPTTIVLVMVVVLPRVTVLVVVVPTLGACPEGWLLGFARFLGVGWGRIV